MNKIKFLYMTVAISFILYTNSIYGIERYNWPKWRGPNGNSITLETGWDPLALIPSPVILWEFNAGYGYSSFCIQGKYFYTMGNIGDEDIVYCLSVDSGKEIWRYSYPCSSGSYPGPRAAPVFDDARIYTVSRKGHLFCFEAATGRLKWKKDLCKSANAEPPRWGIASSVIIENDMLEAIIAMPDQLFYNTEIFTYIWIVSNNKVKKRKGKIQLINAVGENFFKKMKVSLGKKRNYIDKNQIQ